MCGLGGALPRGGVCAACAAPREAEGVDGIGLRGITYLELDGSGRIARVQEGYEPLFKLDTLLEVIFKALAGAAKECGKAPSYEQATPTDAEGIVRYLWEVAYPGGATPADAAGAMNAPFGATIDVATSGGGPAAESGGRWLVSGEHPGGAGH